MNRKVEHMLIALFSFKVTLRVLHLHVPRLLYATPMDVGVNTRKVRISFYYEQIEAESCGRTYDVSHTPYET